MSKGKCLNNALLLVYFNDLLLKSRDSLHLQTDE